MSYTSVFTYVQSEFGYPSKTVEGEVDEQFYLRVQLFDYLKTKGLMSGEYKNNTVNQNPVMLSVLQNSSNQGLVSDLKTLYQTKAHSWAVDTLGFSSSESTNLEKRKELYESLMSKGELFSLLSSTYADSNVQNLALKNYFLNHPDYAEALKVTKGTGSVTDLPSNVTNLTTLEKIKVQLKKLKELVVDHKTAFTVFTIAVALGGSYFLYKRKMRMKRKTGKKKVKKYYKW